LSKIETKLKVGLSEDTSSGPDAEHRKVEKVGPGGG
jgi:hypothetical protein